jgi:hypothetical protein
MDRASRPHVREHIEQLARTTIEANQRAYV